jgi:hypothetical protein
MMRNSILKILNPILALLFLNQILTGMLNGIIPKGAYEFFHEGGGIIFTFAVILHVIFNWNWVKATFLRKKK